MRDAGPIWHKMVNAILQEPKPKRGTKSPRKKAKPKPKKR